MASISIEGLSKVYPNGFQAVDGLNLTVAEGEFMVLVGPSGCGKTTALRMVAGLEEITSGTLRIGSRVANQLASKDRDVAMVFQNYALYPHLTVFQNIAFGLKLRKVPKAEIKRTVDETAAILGLTEVLNRRPALLSGGQRQRVAMGRAIVRNPAVFLMDEPLSNLDAKLRVQMRTEVHRIQRRIGVAALYVTHDQIEAMTMGDRVAVMRSGVLQQCDEPQALYARPRNLFVAAFIGSPAMNLFEATLSENGETLQLGTQSVEMGTAIGSIRPGLAAFRGKKVIVGLRSEDLPMLTDDASPSIGVYVEAVEALGSELLVHFSIDAKRISGDQMVGAESDGIPAAFGVVGEGVARVEPRASIRVGKTTRLRVFPERLHFFDPDSQDAIEESSEHRDWTTRDVRH